MKDTISNYLTSLQQTISNLNIDEIVAVANVLKEARDNGKQVFIFGNGGSASTASHFACDINKGVSSVKYKRFKVICLNDNIPTMLAYSNDMGYDIVFSEKLKNFIQEGDVVIGISGSGNSKNIILAIETAAQHKAITIGITGFGGGKLKELANYSFNANINDMQLSEDVHMIWVHIMMKCFLN
jgi:D-sedoheptulose 7-phosphate isomerase